MVYSASSARLIQFPCNMSAVLILGWTGVQMITEPQFYTLQPAIFFHTEYTKILPAAMYKTVAR